MRSYFSRFSPVPTFPAYTGPYTVGTVDVEIPISELNSPSPAPDTAANIHTIQFRIFYPATPESKGLPISWLPTPQRLHVAAYTQFLGLNPMMASVLSFLPRHLHYTYVPVKKNAPMQPPNTPNGRWPTVVFSHGLGGSRNAYSHIAGSLASHGIVVFCPEHRDGSAVISIIRNPKAQNHSPRNYRRVIPYIRIPHSQTPAIWRARDAQIRTRLWELGLLVEAMVGLDSGMDRLVETNMNDSTTKPSLYQFASKLDVHEPGRVIFAGHSFGAATVVQLLKLTYYADHPSVTSMPDRVFTPAPASHIRRLITESTPAILLDMWCFPLHSATFSPLLPLPLPAYADVPSAPGGTALLAIESEAFYKWTEHLNSKARILSPDPSERVVPPGAFARLPEPGFFYVRGSAHLNQSDFGVLFPWLCRRVFGAKEPERVMRLNMRAVLQHLRANGVPVARTWSGDLVDGPAGGKSRVGAAGMRGDMGADDGVYDDEAILGRNANGGIEAWCWIDTRGLGGKAGRTEVELLSRPGKEAGDLSGEEDHEKQMEGEMEMGVTPVENGAPVGDVRTAMEGPAAY